MEIEAEKGSWNAKCVSRREMETLIREEEGLLVGEEGADLVNVGTSVKPQEWSRWELAAGSFVLLLSLIFSSYW